MGELDQKVGLGDIIWSAQSLYKTLKFMTEF